MQQYTIFLSHSHADNELARQYAVELKARGYDVWLDDNNAQTGSNLSLEITSELNWRTALVVLLTPDSVNSPNVEEECRYFNSRLPDWPRKRFIPVHALDCDVHAKLRLGLTPELVIRKWDIGQYLYIDGRGEPISDTVAKIVQRLEQQPEDPICVDQPFRLDSISEQQLVCLLQDLLRRTYGPAAIEQSIGTETGSRKYRVDLITMRPDEFLSGGELILVEVKKSMRKINLDEIHQLEVYLRAVGAKTGWLMTTGRIDDATKAAAGTTQSIRLFDREDVVKLLRNHGLKFTTDPS